MMHFVIWQTEIYDEQSSRIEEYLLQVMKEKVVHAYNVLRREFKFSSTKYLTDEWLSS